MNRNSIHSMLSVLLCVVLIAALALFAAGCTDTGIPGGTTDPTAPLTSDPTFTFLVVDIDGTETTFEITSSADTVGEALLAEGLIEGEDSEYGLYVKVVNGITADYETDETYWAFYVNGEYALTGVDATAIENGATYSFVKTGPAEDTGSDVTVLGEGANVFTFTVVDPDGNETSYEIHTDETIVGSALLAEGLIAGEDSEYGLYVKTVCGTTLDYATDGMYWGFYINGEYALTGVDATEITAGAVYTFQADKG